jgi:hypothetical protein
MRKLKYREPHPVSREAAEAAFDSENPEQIAEALVNVAFHDTDWRWAQERCLGFLRDDVAAVRQIAVTCLGHLARIHRRLDLERVLPALDEVSHDPAVQVEDALDDIHMFIGR